MKSCLVSLKGLLPRWVDSLRRRIHTLKRSLSTYALLQRALEACPEETGFEQEIVELIEQARTTYQTLAKLHVKLDDLAQEFLHT